MVNPDAQPRAPTPVDPAVTRNPFRQRRYRPEAITPFGQAQSLLPVPVLPEHDRWLEIYWRAWELAWNHLRQAKAGSGFAANFIDSAANGNCSMWDSAFMTQFGVYGRRAFDFMGTLDNFYAKQHDDGFICREINSVAGHDLFYPFDPNGTGPNILAWAEWRVFRHTRDEERISWVFWPLLALHRWFRAHRTWPSGLYWATGKSSGMENQTRVPDSMRYHRHWTWVDATMQASLNCRILAQMANVLDEADAAEELIQEHAFLLREVNARLWNSNSGFYQDADPAGRFSLVKSVGAYWGLLDKDMVPEERLNTFIRHLHETVAFNRPHRIPSQSADSPGYDPETGNYWRGGVWSPTNYMVLKGLRYHGRRELAYQIALNHLDVVWQVFQRTDTLWENYAPEAAAPGEPSKSNYVGWTGLSPISILLEDVIGISVDWPLRRITWDRWLESETPYGVRNYPLGDEGSASLVGGADQIEIETDVPFNLTVRDREGTLQAAVPVGITTLTL